MGADGVAARAFHVPSRRAAALDEHLRDARAARGACFGADPAE